MFTLRIERTIDAPAAIVWDVIADVEAYAAYAPNLSHAEKTGTGATPARRCYDTQGRGWNEACVLWEDGSRYSYIIDTTDYPYPFVQMKGTWGMDEVADGINVWMRFDYTPDAPPLMKWLVHQQVRRTFQPVVRDLMDNWEREIIHRTQQASVGVSSG